MNVAQLSPQEAADFRNREIGYVWQFHYLLPEFTALENVAMPLLARGAGQARSHDRRRPTGLREVDLAIAAATGPANSRGGEQQRVALARALVNNPRLLLADEPTGDLDGATAGRVFDLIERLHASHGLTSILVTHNMELAARCHAHSAPGERPVGADGVYSSNGSPRPDGIEQKMRPSGRKQV